MKDSDEKGFAIQVSIAPSDPLNNIHYIVNFNYLRNLKVYLIT